jgi:hypothetical protein
VKTGPMMNEIGLFKAVPSTIPASEYVYERLNGYKLSHVYLMRQLADLWKTPISALAGDGVIHHFRGRYHGTLILNVGIDRKHAGELLREGFGDLIAFGRDYIANPDLVERIRLDAPLNEQRPEAITDLRRSATRTTPFSTHRQREWLATQARSKRMLKESSVAHSSSTERDTAAERGDPDLKCCQPDEYRQTRRQ